MVSNSLRWYRLIDSRCGQRVGRNTWCYDVSSSKCSGENARRPFHQYASMKYSRFVETHRCASRRFCDVPQDNIVGVSDTNIVHAVAVHCVGRGRENSTGVDASGRTSCRLRPPLFPALSDLGELAVIPRGSKCLKVTVKDKSTFEFPCDSKHLQFRET